MTWVAGIFWYLQDLIQILGGGIFPVPELFFLAVFSAFVAGNEAPSQALWTVFVGGLLWDLRWTGLPGFTAALWAVVMGAVAIFWQAIPVQGRHGAIFLFIAAGSHAALGGCRGLLYALSGFPIWPEILWQQIFGLPLVSIAALWLAHRKESEGVS